ncbi:MAG: hypothetical protein PHH71_00605 [Clostridia bacterium]|jgi:hypothetical protein|nr:hypothetical protein [Clostridia bacterium]MDD3231804.1 hypothetical protein [Clostridia bacterium]MDD3862793.1 hypothetical protein [Clostridia bacterium]MDD4408730.1 hypothetical protein [Clostridia bacterium]
MKFFKSIACCAVALCMSFIMVGCACGAQNITLGTYNEETNTFSALGANPGYSLTIADKDLTLNGEIPYDEDGFTDPAVAAGNIVVIQFKSPTVLGEEDVPVIETKAQGETEFTAQANIEEDKTFVWIVKIDAKTDVNQIKITWTEESDAITYTLKVASTATLEEAPAPEV